VERDRYLKLADACLEQIAAWLEEFDPDVVDFATTDGVVTLEFPDGARYVLNRQAGASQMWFAASARAWHYGWDEQRGAWLDDRDGHALLDRLGEEVSRKIGREVSVPAP
jgi:CyaY protein